MKEGVLTGTKFPMSVEAYIAFEERAEIRHEFINGTLYPMPGTTDDHNEICFNIKNALKHLLPELKVYTESVKAQILASTDYTYPDVMVAPDPRDLEDKYIKKYPSIIFEVISKSSRLEDQVDKFLRYKSIEPLQHYILVDSEKVWVEVRSKNAGGEWEASTYLKADEDFPVSALGLRLALKDIYNGVAFQAGAGK